MTSVTPIRRACDSIGGVAAMARRLVVYRSAVYSWIDGRRQVPIERCVQIERITNGAVKCEELRPDKAEHFAYLRGLAAPTDVD